MFQTVVNHARYVMAPTKGYPGSQNDKTVSRLDKAFHKIRFRDPCVSTTFTLLEEGGTKDGKATVHAGLYLLVDGGYHQVRCYAVVGRMA